MMYDGIINKPPLEDVYLEHGWLKDQAAKVHKYIERHRGKNGKWIYRYKSKAQELGTKVRRFINDPEATPYKITDEYGRTTVGGSTYRKLSNGSYKRNHSVDWMPRSNNSGNHYTGKYSYGERGSTGARGTRYQEGLKSGRKRAAKKGYAVQGYRGKKGSNLSSRGYSNSNSPKGITRLTFKGHNFDIPEYDNISEVFGPISAYKKGKNDAFVSRGTNAGRKRVSKKKK